MITLIEFNSQQIKVIKETLMVQRKKNVYRREVQNPKTPNNIPINTHNSKKKVLAAA